MTSDYKEEMRLLKEKMYKERLEALGRYEYIEGFTNYASPVKVRHKACGSILTMIANGALIMGKTDTCKACRGDSSTPRYVNNRLETDIERYCRHEAKPICETMSTEGYLFGKELEEYVRLCLLDIYFIRNNRFDIEDCLDLVLENVYTYYRKNYVGVCKCCKKVQRGKTRWAKGNGYRIRLCDRCHSLKKDK